MYGIHKIKNGAPHLLRVKHLCSQYVFHYTKENYIVNPKNKFLKEKNKNKLNIEENLFIFLST